MNSTKILIVDDESTLIKTIQVYLEREGYLVSVAYSGLQGLKRAAWFDPSLIILNAALLGMNEMTALQRLRSISEAYVLMLTAKTSEQDKIMGLTYGADDYLTKPFTPHELVARVKVIFQKACPAPSGTNDVISEPPARLRINEAARKVWKDGTLIELTLTEFDLLQALLASQGQALSREQLIEQVWHYNFYGNERVIDVHLRRLRKKIEDDPKNPSFITTVRGIGYRFEG